MSEPVKVVFIVGPTASGKTAAALAAANELGGEIINADSIQVYQSLDIGSAKPTKKEMANTRHHLVGYVPEGDNYTAGRFRKDVLEILKERTEAGVKRFYIVGGSGFYIKALLHGMFEVGEIPQAIKDQVKSEPAEVLYKELQTVDPISAETISPRDSYRISRAIEVYRGTGRAFSSFKQDFSEVTFPYPYIKVGLTSNKDFLRERVITRTTSMLNSGLVTEVEELLARGLGEWDALSSVGYKEVVEHLQGKIPHDELHGEIVKNTMGLIKKQMTWFKKDKEVTWFDVAEGDFSETVKKIIQFIKEQL